MFGFPDSKRVRREDLESPRSTPPQDDDAFVAAVNRLRALNSAEAPDNSHEIVRPPSPPRASSTSSRQSASPAPPVSRMRHRADDRQDPSESAPTYAFQLFAAPHSSRPTSAHVTQIRLDSPAAPVRAPQRAPSHYFAEAPSAKRTCELASVALTGAVVRERSRLPFYGLRMPWRVMLWPGADQAIGADAAAAVAEQGVGAGEGRRRGRPGKKKRLRGRIEVKRAAAETERREREERGKEEQVREKKSRLNRAKQLKKREKERRKAVAG